jgi:uncharacterized protein
MDALLQPGSPWPLLLLALVGAVAGCMNVLAGGGSLLTMPVLRLLGWSGPVVNGTNRVALLAQNAVAVFRFYRHGYRDFRVGLLLSVCALPGAIAGALAGVRLEGAWFNRVLAAVMIAVLILMSSGRKGAGSPVSPPGRLRVAAAHASMLLVGFYGGFIQAGVGFLVMAVLHRILGLDLVRVNMHKVLIIGVYTLVVLPIYAGRAGVVWDAGLALAIGNAAGGWVGGHLNLRGGERWIRRLVLVLIALLAAKLLWSSLR